MQLSGQQLRFDLAQVGTKALLKAFLFHFSATISQRFQQALMLRESLPIIDVK